MVNTPYAGVTSARSHCVHVICSKREAKGNCCGWSFTNETIHHLLFIIHLFCVQENKEFCDPHSSVCVRMKGETNRVRGGKKKQKVTLMP
ncbi:hypothetical protein DPEC_G00017790 [Dallia pectoralis]|uniref:Uncharacterized protein n=1 Tax=Dallia pectoralis TaxID=75939 RepID=A0ACC2HFX3_DALPE|nr:hypothetical protein DPEC_G00017790 [Dallia pectoralis]